MSASNWCSASASRASPTPLASMISCRAWRRFETRIRRRCGSSSTINILPIAYFLVVRTNRKFDRKTHAAGLVTAEPDFASVRSHNTARDRESEPVAALLGGKQRLENSIDAFWRDSAQPSVRGGAAQRNLGGRRNARVEGGEVGD